jgi:hypothetical protein
MYDISVHRPPSDKLGAISARAEFAAKHHRAGRAKTGEAIIKTQAASAHDQIIMNHVHEV